MNRARLFVISAPSGCGKGTLLAKAFENRDVYYSVSYTTREKRKGEKEGVNYFYVNRKQFEKMIDDRDFLEYARYVDNYYGTPKIPVFEHLARGTDVILEIDTVGAFQVKQSYRDAVLVFVLPPSVGELMKRLKKRGTESQGEIDKRLLMARREITKAYKYDYVILNDDLDQAVEDLLCVVDAARAENNDAFRHSLESDDAIKLIEKVIINA